MLTPLAVPAHLSTLLAAAAIAVGVLASLADVYGPTVLLGAAAFAVFLFVRRYGGGVAMGELERANRVLEAAVKELREKNAALTIEVATLRARTDIVAALAPVLSGIELHEERATERSLRMLTVLDLIASRLGPETNGV